MMFLKSSLLAVILSFSLQEGDENALLKSYPTKATSLATDQFGNIYAAGGFKLEKLDKDGNFLYKYDEVKNGKIGSVDVSNPLKVTVFYPDFMVAVTLDRYLAPITSYRFYDLGFQTISAVASSSDGRLWFYDLNDFKLKKIDENGEVYRESQPTNLVCGEVIQPNFIVEKNNQVFVNDPNKGIFVFDIFATFNKVIPIKNLKKFQLFQDQIIYFENTKLKSYALHTFEIKALNLPDTIDVKGAVIEKERLILLKNTELNVYKQNL